MPFPSTSAFTIFAANTKAKSAEVNANFAAVAAWLNTTTTDILVGSVWQKIANTAADYTITHTDGIRTLLVNANTMPAATSASYIALLPTAASSINRMLSFKNTGQTVGTLVLDGVGSEMIDNTATMQVPTGDAITLHCDGSQWRVIGCFRNPKNVAKSADYTAQLGDNVRTILMTTAGTDRTVTLPSASTNTNRVITVKKVDSGTGVVIIDGEGVQTIDGSLTWTLSAKKDFITLESDGAHWHVVAISQTDAVAKSADYTIADGDGVRTVLMTTGAGSDTVTLPTAADNNGRIITIKKVDSGAGAVTIDGEGSETIDGETTVSLFTQWSEVTVQSDGTGWNIIGGAIEGSIAPTFTGDGVGATASSAATVQITRRGRVVTLDFPQVSDSTPAGTTSRLEGSVALPSWARPSLIKSFTTYGKNNGAFAANQIWQANINTDGTIHVYRDPLNTTFTNGATAGFQRFSATYTV